jgi:O-antigen/teichoic acid export membrane protein
VLSLPAVRVLTRAHAGSPHGDSRELLHAAVPLGCAQLFVVAAGRLDTVLLGAMAGVTVGGGFEGAWRVYQLSQYIVGGLASAAAPFVSNAIGSARRGEALAIVRRIGMLVLLAGLACGAVTLLFAGTICRILFGDSLGPAVAHALAPLALITPVTFVALFATVLLAISPSTRWWILPANALGAIVNVVLILTIASNGELRRATLACAIGLAVTSCVLLVRFTVMAVSLAREGRDAGELGPQAAVALGPGG